MLRPMLNVFQQSAQDRVLNGWQICIYSKQRAKRCRGFMINDPALKMKYVFRCTALRFLWQYSQQAPAEPEALVAPVRAGQILFQGLKKKKQAAGRTSSENVSEMDSRWLWFVLLLCGMC